MAEQANPDKVQIERIKPEIQPPQTPPPAHVVKPIQPTQNNPRPLHNDPQPKR